MKEITQVIDKLKVKISETRAMMGQRAAWDVGDRIRKLLDHQELVNIVFAAAPSQNEFLSALSRNQEVDFTRINAFHMDEYIGLEKEHSQRFGNYLRKMIFDIVPFRSVHYLEGNTGDPAEECRRYSHLLLQYPTDIVCMGIGENTHLAFNDPHVARFDDPLLVKKVHLDPVSRQQQVNDGCFSDLRQVPTSALTLTIPALLRANDVFCIVPGASKAEAVAHTLHSPVGEAYPSTALRMHPDATLYLDRDSAAKI